MSGGCSPARRGAWLGRYLLPAVVAGLILTACGGDDGSSGQAGEPSVHARIEALDDCDQLQDEFDTASRNNETADTDTEREQTIAYMKTADERMKELGCYDE